jgi:hypothetical protein
VAGLWLATGGSLALPAAAGASSRQIAIIQDDAALETNPVDTLKEFRALGATTVRVIVHWDLMAPHPDRRRIPAGFDSSDPNAYSASVWSPYDRIVTNAVRDGMTVDFTVAGGAPRWAEGARIPPPGRKNPYYAWRPSAKLYGAFFHAVAERYDGSFMPPGAQAPLPAVRFWAIWNEPNFGEDLAPQATNGSSLPVGPTMYRGMVRVAWAALQQTGHSRDTILIGGFAPSGVSGRPSRSHPGGLPGNYAMTKPLVFVRALYCVGTDYRPLRGSHARARGCPTTAAGSNRFRARNPGLFQATGIADHPYEGGRPPVRVGKTDPSYATFPQLPNLERALDRVTRAYGSRRRYPIYDDEFGYITRPPNGPRYADQETASYYLNWSEYLSWKNARVASYAQYLLDDPQPEDGRTRFASGLVSSTGKPKATYAAYRLPLYLPRTAIARGRPAEVWGDVRPAHFTAIDTGTEQTVAIQLKPRGQSRYQTIDTVSVSTSNGYFDVRVRLPSSGVVRLAYTYPQLDPLLPIGVAGSTVFSRQVKVRVR